MASRTRDSMYENEKLFRRILDERTAGFLLDADTKVWDPICLWVREIATQMTKYQSQAQRQ